MACIDDDWEPLRHPGYYFSRIARELSRIGDARLRGLGFVTAQLSVLAALKNGEQLSQTELARRAKVEQPTMAQMLARMARDGLVKREPDPRDRRSSLMEPLARLSIGREVLRQGNSDIMNGLSSEEADILVSLLKRVLDNVEAISELGVI